MAAKRAPSLTPYFILFSLLIHFLLLMLYFYFSHASLLIPPKNILKQKTPNEFVPAYTYTSPPSLNLAAQKSPTANNKIAAKPRPQKPLTKNTLHKPQVISTQPRPTSFINSSLEFLKNEQIKEMSTPLEEEPIYLIGDSKQPPNLLIKLLARSLSHNFRYPEHAGRFGIKGKALVSFVLDPDGTISHIRLIQSSNFAELDAAALYAANSAPRIVGAAQFISKPKNFVVGFVFR